MEFGRGGSSSLVYGVLLVMFVLVTVTSAQITFSRQWVRGKYPGDNEGGESPEFQRAAKAVFPKRTFTRYVKPSAMSDYVPILVNAQVLEELMERVREPPNFGLGSASAATSGISPLESSRK